MRDERREVLVVGAGPVGLWTALVLSELGVEVKIIDLETRVAARSYACALHPGTLRAFDQYGLAQPVIEAGRKISTFAFYEGQARQAEVKMDRGGEEYPFVLIVPQNVLEGILERRLKAAGVEVNWGHRLDNFVMDHQAASVSVEKLEETSTGYVVPHSETVVSRNLPLRCQFIVGADGHNSITRHRLGIPYRKFHEAEAFAACEFETEAAVEDEVHVVIDDRSTNVLWPLTGNRCRWTFQILHTETAEFPLKERRAIHLENKMMDDRVRDFVQRMVAKRAPWFKAPIKEVTWCTQVAFEERLVESFGKGRAWLVGDAAHQAGPVGVQSMNAGFSEGTLLASALRSIIHENGEMQLLEEFNKTALQRWSPLLRPARLGGNSSASAWVKSRADRLLSCLPGIDEHFVRLASQLGIAERS